MTATTRRQFFKKALSLLGIALVAPKVLFEGKAEYIGWHKTKCFTDEEWEKELKKYRGNTYNFRKDCATKRVRGTFIGTGKDVVVDLGFTPDWVFIKQMKT